MVYWCSHAAILGWGNGGQCRRLRRGCWDAAAGVQLLVWRPCADGVVTLE